MIPIQTKGIFSIIGSCCNQLCLFSLFVFSNLSVYIISYLKHTNPSLRLEHGYFLGPLCTFTMNCCNFLGGVVDNTFGVHITIIAGSSIIVIASVSLLFSTNLYLDYAIMFLFGLGFGLACMASFKNSCRYFPHRRGLITGIIGAFGNIGSSLYNYLGSTIINPEQIKAGEGGFYPYDIAKRFNYYLYMKIGSFAILSSLALLFIFQYKEEEYSNTKVEPIKNIDSQVSEIQEDLNPVEAKINKDNEENADNVVASSKSAKEHPQPSKTEYKKHLKKIFTSGRLWFLFSLFFSTSFGIHMISTTFMTFGTKEKIDTKLLTYTSTIYFLGSCLFGLAWGIIYDKYGFKTCILIVSGIGAIVSNSIYFAKDIPYLFSVLIILNGGIASGMFSILFPHIITIFSHTYSTEIYGIISMSFGSSSIMSGIFAFIVTKIMTDVDMKSYMFAYILGGILSIVAFIFGLFESDEPFSFRDGDDDNH